MRGLKRAAAKRLNRRCRACERILGRGRKRKRREGGTWDHRSRGSCRNWCCTQRALRWAASSSSPGCASSTPTAPQARKPSKTRRRSPSAWDGPSFRPTSTRSSSRLPFSFPLLLDFYMPRDPSRSVLSMAFWVLGLRMQVSVYYWMQLTDIVMPRVCFGGDNFQFVFILSSWYWNLSAIPFFS